MRERGLEDTVGDLRDAMGVGSSIINGIGSNLVPAGNATRAQVATMFMRYSTNK